MKAEEEAEALPAEPTKLIKPQYTPEQLKSLNDHVKIKIRMEGDERIRLYRVKEEDTITAVFDRIWIGFEPSAGPRDRYYLCIGDTILSSRRKLKDYDIKEGDVLDIVEDTE